MKYFAPRMFDDTQRVGTAQWCPGQQIERHIRDPADPIYPVLFLLKFRQIHVERLPGRHLLVEYCGRSGLSHVTQALAEIPEDGVKQDVDGQARELLSGND
jgi:hypothetical protein